MRNAVPNPNPNQFNISLSPDTKKRLQEMAKEFRMKKASKVGANIIETYLERWATLQRRKEHWLDEQEKQMLELIDQQMRGVKPPLEKGDTQSKPAGRKRRP